MKLKHCFQRFAAALACLMLCMLCLPQAALAAGEGYIQLTDDQLQQECTLALTCHVNGEPMTGVEFQIFKVAGMTRDVQFTLTGGFEDYEGLDANQIRSSLGNVDWPKAAEALCQYAVSKKLSPAAEMTVDEDGTATAKKLSVGLYLVVGAASRSGTEYSDGESYYRPAPFLVSLPHWSDGQWKFDLSGAAKAVEVLTGSRVLKRWVGGTPVPVDVQLYRDGAPYGEPVTLDSENNWRHDFGGLEAEHTWTLQETNVPAGFTSTVTQEGITFVVTNNYQGGGGGDENPPREDPPGENPGGGPGENPGGDPPDNNPDQDIEEPEVPLVDMPNMEIDDPEVPLSTFTPDPDLEPEAEIPEEEVPLSSLPQTGLLWWPVPVLAAGGVLFFLFGLSRNRRREY